MKTKILKLEGISYKAVPCRPGNNVCTGCAFDDDARLCEAAPVDCAKYRFVWKRVEKKAPKPAKIKPMHVPQVITINGVPYQTRAMKNPGCKGCVAANDWDLCLQVPIGCYDGSHIWIRQQSQIQVPVKRPSWDVYFMRMAQLASERSTCPRLHCGCVLVRDKFVLGTGYNGSLPGAEHCDDVGCLMVDNHCVRTNHAEINAVCQAAQHGTVLRGATAYVTGMPCATCAKALIAAGIVRVVFDQEYGTAPGKDFFETSKVELVQVKML